MDAGVVILLIVLVSFVFNIPQAIIITLAAVASNRKTTIDALEKRIKALESRVEALENDI